MVRSCKQGVVPRNNEVFRRLLENVASVSTLTDILSDIKDVLATQKKTLSKYWRREAVQCISIIDNQNIVSGRTPKLVQLTLPTLDAALVGKYLQFNARKCRQMLLSRLP